MVIHLVKFAKRHELAFDCVTCGVAEAVCTAPEGHRDGMSG